MTTTELPARDRILAAASRRYYAEGIRAASADRLLADAGVSKVTFYRHFPSKDDLVVAYLEGAAAAEQSGFGGFRAAHPDDPAETLCYYARTIAEISCGPGFRGCPFINAAAELSDPAHPGRTVIARHREWLTTTARELLEQMGVPDPHAKADALMMLRDGAMVRGYVDGDPTRVAASLEKAAAAVIGT